ncbi:hypothetical protein [Sphingopyxis indica]|uniref:HNH endonuclease n=1 Tax=Sphingopyxis indica TaxID=436663 RepID=A0A239HAZ2_9SPHN|nr:hypothetical protein [Sphingopyxis indica]SNS77424.1 hypothetical protein SAMN06295955_10521 [Sphingopyxis indica]
MTAVATATEPNGVCAFCDTQARLHESHVLPAFVYRWLRGRSGTGHIRQTDNPNRRVQDGLKLPWLCGGCEAQFSRYETAFATKVFHPWQAGTYRIPYDGWLLKFCVSVSWRVLRFARGRNKDASYTDEQQVLMDRAEAHWRAFLRDEAPHPGAFEQHLLIFDLIEDTTVPDLPTNMNRFMTGAVTLDIVGSDRSLMTFAKLGRFTIFGIIQKGPGKWEGTKVHVKHGLLKPGKFVVPAGLLHLFREKAALASEAMIALSPTQRAKVDKHVLGNLDAFAASDQFASIVADARMFGEDAVLWKE